MSNSVIIKSPNPNNGLIHVLSQTTDATGAPVGAPVAVATLDDGQEYTGQVAPHAVIVLVFGQRSAPAAAPSAPKPEIEAAIAVIGGTVEQSGTVEQTGTFAATGTVAA